MPRIPDDVPVHRGRVGAMEVGPGPRSPWGSERRVRPYVYRGTGEDTISIPDWERERAREARREKFRAAQTRQATVLREARRQAEDRERSEEVRAEKARKVSALREARRQAVEEPMSVRAFRQALWGDNQKRRARARKPNPEPKPKPKPKPRHKPKHPVPSLGWVPTTGADIERWLAETS